MVKENFNKRISLVFNDNRAFTELEFADYYDYVYDLVRARYDSRLGKENLKQISDYLKSYEDVDSVYYYEDYSNCPNDIKMEITRLIGEIIIGYLSYSLYNSRNDMYISKLTKLD